MPEPSLRFTSDIFRVSHRQLIATMLLLYSGPVLMILSALALPALLAGIFLDLRWLVVFMMIVFLLTPMLLTFLYFFHGLRMSTSSNVVPHSLAVSDQGITVTLYDRVDLKDGSEENGSNEDEEVTDTKEDKEDREDNKGNVENNNGKGRCEYKYRSEKLYPFSLIADLKIASKGQIIQLKSPEKGFVWLMPDGFPTRDDYAGAVRFIRNLIENENTEG